MTLVERFIEFNSWSDSRKTALLTGISLPGVVGLWVLCEIFWTDLPIVDSQLVRLMNAVLLAAYLATFSISLAVAKKGWDAPWTPYMAVMLVGGSIAFTIYLFGIWVASAYALYPISVMVLLLWYDENVGWFTLIVGAIILAVLSALQIAGLIPFAPALLERSIDAQLDFRWVTGGTLIVMLYFASAFTLGVLVIAAKRLQERRLVQAQALIRRYVPSQIADAIVSGNVEAASRHERRKLTIFFSDLVGFTDISEELEPEDLSRVLNEYFSEMTAIAQKHGGTVDELSGDAILIFFGAPHATDDKDHALRAVRMAMDMQQAMESLNAKWRSAGIPELIRVRMGINTGVVTIGNFGSPDRMKYAALGKHVNLAARIQSQCEPGRVLLSYTTWLLVNDQIQCAPKGEMQFKGIHKPVQVYEVAV